MTKPIKRRTFLRGAGTAIALPMLEAMLPTRSSLGREVPQGLPPMYNLAPKPGDAPRRLAYLFVPNGMHMPDWTPEKEGGEYTLPSTLAPLEKLRDKITVLSGLAHDKARANGDGAGDHARCAATFLTGAQAVKTAGKGIRVGMSVDQIAAQQIGQQTPLASLELGCEPGALAGRCDSGYSCAYVHSISWRRAATPVAKEINPREVFNRLFGNGTKGQRQESESRRRALRKSILDMAREDTKQLTRKLGKTDQQKLEEYLDSIREIERRIDTPTVDLEIDGKLRRPDGIPSDYAQHVRLMGDLMVLAFRADITRVCSFMFANGGSGRAYREIGVREGHHPLSHHQNNKKKQTQIAKINHYHVEQLAYILQKMEAIEEANGSTLLDNTMLVYGSGIGDGNAHNHDDLPILLAGGGGGTIKTGRHIRYKDETPLMNLHLSLLDRAGVKTKTAGDSTGRLDFLLE